MQGPKTHEQQRRMLENKPDVPDVRRDSKAAASRDQASPPLQHPERRQSEFPISRQGMNQESDHNKHNDAGQSGHKPQQHSEAEQKQD